MARPAFLGRWRLLAPGRGPEAIELDLAPRARSRLPHVFDSRLYPVDRQHSEIAPILRAPWTSRATAHHRGLPPLFAGRPGSCASIIGAQIARSVASDNQEPARRRSYRYRISSRAALSRTR